MAVAGGLKERFKAEFVRLLAKASAEPEARPQGEVQPRPGSPEPVVVAFSGGLDSTVLLHLLRFRCRGLALEWVPVHLDHGMRPDSAADALWARGVCSAWGLELESTVASERPADEAAARRVRYRFLHQVARSRGARWILTGHHGDDQAESVLFRAARGAGIRGLGGIAPVREDGVLRPLLPFFREELTAYAAENRLSWRDDPTNRDLGFARNAIRARILPELEAAVPGARASLARLASVAREEEEAWGGVIPILLDRIGLQPMPGVGSAEPSGFRWSRDELLALTPPVRGRVLRALAHGLGRPLDRRGTRAALEFISAGHSGRIAPLGGGLALGRDFGDLTLRVGEEVRAEEAATSEPGDAVEIRRSSEGRAEMRVAGNPCLVEWGRGEPPKGIGPAVRLRESGLRFPLQFRAEQPGDRIELGFGSKKVRKFLAEKGVPLSERRGAPVLADAEGSVLWIPGYAVAFGAEAPEDGSDEFFVAIREDGNAVGQ
jgi:tRNA(Ile)-lysidine synthase